MKLTRTLQKLTAGMATFALVIMSAVLAFGTTKPVWAVAETVDTYYVNSREDFSAALSVANPGDTIVINDDFLIEGDVYTISKAIVLDLHGHSIGLRSRSTSYGIVPNFLVIKTVQNFVIMDSSAEQTGVIYRERNYYGSMPTVLIDDQATVIIKSGTISSDNMNTALSIQDGSVVTMHGGTIKHSVKFYDSDNTKSQLIVRGGNIQAQIAAADLDKVVFDASACETVTYDSKGNLTALVLPVYVEPEPEPEPEVTLEDPAATSSFPWVPVAISAGVGIVALSAAITVACLVGRRK